jgi:predicted transcriptional regulator
MNLIPVSVIQQVKNFAICQERPFSVSYAAIETGLNKDTVRKYLRNLENKGMLRRVYNRRDHRNFYTIQKSGNRSVGAAPTKAVRSKGMNYNLSHIKKIISVIQNNDCSSLLQIGKIIGKSKQFCCTYMIAMASAGMVGFDGSYYTKDESRILDIGKNIDSYILEKMRKEVSDKRKLQKALVKTLKKMIRVKKLVRKLELAQELAGKR